jgi:hypothetical protein
MRDLTAALIVKGYTARYEMTGGNCGTIYLYDGENEFLAIGPSDFATGEANSDELNWGTIETDEDEGTSAYFDEDNGIEFNVENVTNAIDDWQI